MSGKPGNAQPAVAPSATVAPAIIVVPVKTLAFVEQPKPVRAGSFRAVAMQVAMECKAKKMTPEDAIKAVAEKLGWSVSRARKCLKNIKAVA